MTSEIVATTKQKDSSPNRSNRRFYRRYKPRQTKQVVVSSVPFVETIGELSTKQVFRSLDSAGSATIVRFDYNGEEETCVLCWMDENGKKHHFYHHSGKNWSHQEHTLVGHAFAIFRKRDGKLLASYRPRASFSKDQVHAVALSSSSLPSAKIETICSEARVMACIKDSPEFPLDKSWTVSYSFSVPPLPQSSSSDFFQTHTFYVWGDLSFDEFSLDDSKTPIHNYKMNQIVPQVMCGQCLCGSDPTSFNPSWGVFNRWVAQAQHYFQTEKGEEHGSRAVCGRLFDVEPGEKMRTTIYFTGSDMIICIGSEDHPDHFSQITTYYPFPDNTALFAGGWSDFFKSKSRSSTKTFHARPCFNIEYKAHKVDLKILESLCPFRIHEAKFPGSVNDKGEEMAKEWDIRSMNFKAVQPMIDFC